MKVLVTGSSKGIGKAVALRLAASYDLILHASSEDSLAPLWDVLPGQDRHCRLCADFSNPAAVKNFCSRLKKEHGEDLFYFYGHTFWDTIPPNDGYYCIANNTSSWGSFAAADWIDIKDKSADPQGYMMVVNASNQPGIFYQKTVPVCESTVYEFSADVISMLESHLANLIQPNIAFMIDGQTVCETGNIQADEQWHTYRFSFATAPGQTTVTLALRNSAPGGGGNDLALDNISFRACGPNILLPATIPFCKSTPVGLQATLNNSPYTTVEFQWQILENGTWQNIPGANSPNLSITQPVDGNQYRLLVANSLANLSEPHCRVASAPVSLDLRPDLDLMVQVENVVCKGDSNGKASVQPLSGQGSFVYAWTNGASTMAVENLSPGLYSVTVTDGLGCTGVLSGSISEAEFPLQLSMVKSDVSCQGVSDGAAAAVVSGGVAPYLIQWNTGQSTTDLNQLPPGKYMVTAIDANQCKIEDSLSLFFLEIPSVAIHGDLEIELGEYLQYDVVTSFPQTEIEQYTWTTPTSQEQCSDCPRYRFQPKDNGCIRVLIQDYRSCIAEDTLCYTVIPKRRVYAPNVFKPDDDGKNDRFTLYSDASVDEIIYLSVYNRWGVLVFESKGIQPNNESNGWDGLLNGKQCEAGVYTWVAEVAFLNKEKIRYAGDVTLIR